MYALLKYLETSKTTWQLLDRLRCFFENSLAVQ